MKKDNPTSAPDAWVFLSGVQGSGKSSIAEPLHSHFQIQQVACSIVEGDKYQTPQAVRTMQAGGGVEELGDQYRKLWLHTILGACRNEQLRGNHVICSCSLLTKELRDQALKYAKEFEASAMILWIEVPEDELRHRLKSRRNHFAPAAMLDKQLAALEKPTDTEGPEVVVIDGVGNVADVALRACQAIEQRRLLAP